MDLDIDYGAGCSNLNAINNHDTDQGERVLFNSTPQQKSNTAGDMDTINQYRNAKKRRLSDEDSAPSEKVFIKDSSDCDTSSLLNLSDEVLLEILKNCSGPELLSISKTCRRLNTLIWDRRLWRVFDFSTEPLAAEKIMHRIKYANKETKAFMVKGLVSKYPQSTWRNTTVTFWMLSKLREECPELNTLAIYDGYLNFEHMSITDFPNTLKKLIFSACEVDFPPPPKVFFNHIDYHLQNLEELSLERCRWFETHDLIIFSKLPKLKKLTLRGCPSLLECVPYGSIATRFGFRTLEVLDIRETPVSDSDIQCFNVTTTLRELFMECPEQLRKTATNTTRPSSSRTTIRPIEPIIPDVAPQQQQQGDVPPVAPGAPPPNENQQNHVIHIVVQDRNYLNINERIRNGNEQPNRNNENEAAGEANRPQEPAVGRSMRLIPSPAEQQLIIVRGNGNNNDGRINRISWEIVNCNLHHPRQSSGPIVSRPGQQITFEPPPMALISDRGIQCFGIAKNNVQDNIVWIRAEERSPDTFIEKMVIRHYKLVTDISLRHLINCAPNLKLLDVTGTSVTLDGVNAFKVAKPQCKIISDFDM